MNKGTVNMMVVLAALVVLGGCGTTATRQAGMVDRPILSAAEAKTMISVEVRVLEPLSVENAVAAAYSETD